jgi:hypothetical protein
MSRTYAQVVDVDDVVFAADVVLFAVLTPRPWLETSSA